MPVPVFHQYMSEDPGKWRIALPFVGAGNGSLVKLGAFSTPEAATIAAAEALVNEDASLIGAAGGSFDGIGEDGKPKNVRPHRWSEAHIDGDEIVIRQGIESLPDALKQNPRDDSYSACKITDVAGFAKEVVCEMNREAEDGTTAVHLLLDSAMAAAIDNGSQWVDYVEPNYDHGSELEES